MRKWRCNGVKEKIWRGSKSLSPFPHPLSIFSFPHSLIISFPFSRLLSIFSFSRHFLGIGFPASCNLCSPGTHPYIYIYPTPRNCDSSSSEYRKVSPVCLFVFVYFPECIFPTCIFTKCTRLTHLLALRVYFYRRASLR